MPGGWAGSDRRSRLPDNWPELCRQVHARSKWRCEFMVPFFPGARGLRKCGRPAGGGVDHIVRGDDHRLENLRDSCSKHHGAKSSAEGNQAKAEKKIRGRLPPEHHPGIIRS